MSRATAATDTVNTPRFDHKTFACDCSARMITSWANNRLDTPQSPDSYYGWEQEAPFDKVIDLVPFEIAELDSPKPVPVAAIRIMVASR